MCCYVCMYLCLFMYVHVCMSLHVCMIYVCLHIILSVYNCIISRIAGIYVCSANYASRLAVALFLGCCGLSDLWHRPTLFTKSFFCFLRCRSRSTPLTIHLSLSFAVLGLCSLFGALYLRPDYHCWTWLKPDYLWEVLFHGVVTRALESVWT